jgi:uncharacterized membrane protein
VVVAYAVVFSAAGVLDYIGFRSASYDLGNAAQAIWSTAHGHILETTAENGNAFSRLGWHVDPLLVLFSPLWWIWSSPVILLVVQALAVSLGALPVFSGSRESSSAPRRPQPRSRWPISPIPQRSGTRSTRTWASTP